MKNTSYLYFKLLSIAIAVCFGSCTDKDTTNTTDNEPEVSTLNITAVDKLTKVLPNNHYTTESGLYAHVARGEYATFQLVLRSNSRQENVNVSVDHIDFGTVNNMQPAVGKVGYVLAALAHTASAPDHIVSETNYYPDPITEAENIDIAPNTNQAIWISIFVPRDR